MPSPSAVASHRELHVVSSSPMRTATTVSLELHIVPVSSPAIAAMAGAIVNSVAYGPNLVDPPDVPPDPTVESDLTIEVVTVAALNTVLTTLPDSFDRGFRDDLNDTGSASISVSNLDADLAHLDIGNLINFKVFGQRAFTMLIERLRRDLASPGEEYGQVTRVEGRSHLALFESAVVYPSLGVDQLPIEEDRAFNWTARAPIYDDTGWGTAQQFVQQSSFLPWFVLPNNWPIPTAWWIWGPGTTSWAEPGICYFRKSFTIPDGVTRVFLAASADDQCTVYLDGQKLINEGAGFRERAREIEVNITPGSHLIAASALNGPPQHAALITETAPLTHTVVAGNTLWGLATHYYGSGRRWPEIYWANQAQIQADATAAGLWNPFDPGHWIFPGQVFNIPGFDSTVAATNHNPAGFLCAVYTVDANNDPATTLVQTDNSWKVVPYPSQPPGMTLGRVVRVMLEEAQTRGALPGVTLTFSDFVDSAGAAWPIVTDISTKVGTTYLTFIRELTTTYADIRMEPGSLRLHAWNKGGATRDRAVTLTVGTNVERLTHTVTA